MSNASLQKGPYLFKYSTGQSQASCQMGKFSHELFLSKSKTLSQKFSYTNVFSQSVICMFLNA